ncbi:NADH dehydrogenase (ubiquinone) Fe-S protein 4 [Fonticula alba]|uniref:NADH dehydrogenase [ubiquinone] iron-sulfur protein 4, mitochondrial n=1 Tax=Fonticula alba TaxID=691883 RepID=A0A058Z6F4_FONAL|nr:NADH dehydrogenase (ubiquinone) Fe-S protein 4 [Fonticula alba]KCV69473.1 NADH dehydrogenase (ubiquinone) Fe-S protein 4 [Fonticula alba]|eukprot:XP_009496038.1 NADH dehydrogenase (ubiquinone) Fe-S protein 4 [Fonticula alba]
MLALRTARLARLTPVAARAFASVPSAGGVVPSASKDQEVEAYPDGSLANVAVNHLPLAKFRSDIGATSGQPVQHAARTVRIIRPPMNAMQSGTFQTRYYKIEFDVNQRWENPLMGWTSSNDPLQAIDMALRFNTLEQAQRFAERQGWAYTCVADTATPPAEFKARHKPTINRNYAENFRHSAQKLRFIRTK